MRMHQALLTKSKRFLDGRMPPLYTAESNPRFICVPLCLCTLFMPRSSTKPKTSSRSSKKTSKDVDEYKPPILSISAAQLKFLHLAAPYHQRAEAEGEGQEFIDGYFEDVYHRLYPVPHHEYFCMEAADHGKSVLKKVRPSLACSIERLTFNFSDGYSAFLVAANVRQWS